MTTAQLSRPSADVAVSPPVTPRTLARRTGRRLARVAVFLVASLAVSAGANAALALHDGQGDHYGRMVSLPGGAVNGHYLHHHHSPEIAGAVRAFLTEPG